jgi:hypothetical protein
VGEGSVLREVKVARFLVVTRRHGISKSLLYMPSA